MTDSDTTTSKRRKAFMLAGEIVDPRTGQVGLTDEERHELATIILRRDVTSWGDLNEIQYGRILDALEGYEKINQLLDMRP